MSDFLAFALALFVLYVAWRAIRGGFERPQSEKLNAFGYVGLFVMLVVALSFAATLFE